VAGIEGFRRSYRLVFSLPSGKVLSLLMAASLLSTAAAVISGRVNVPEALGYLLLFAVILPLLTRVSNAKVFTWRRSFALSPFALLSWSLSSLLMLPCSSKLLALFLFLWYLPLRGLARTYHALAMVAVSVTAILSMRALTSAAAYCISVALVEISLGSAERWSAQIGLSALESFRKLAHYLLTGDKEEMEDLLLELSEEDEVRVDVLKFLGRNGEVLGALVVPYIHPGPFRDLGSSTLPSLIAYEAGRRRVPVVVLRGPSTHEQDLALREDAERIAREVARWIVEGTGEVGTGGGASLAEDEQVSVLCLRLGFPIAFLEHKDGGEDFPFLVAKRVWEVSEHITLVDLHNSLSESFPRAEVSETVVKACETAPIEGELMVGIYTLKPDLPPLEVGPGGVAALSASVGDSTYCIVCFDSNNIVRGVREVIQERLKESVHVRGIIATTDTHLMTGAYSRRDYYPLGSLSGPQRVAQTALEAAVNAVKRMREVDKVIRTRLVFRARTLRADSLETLSEITERSVRRVALAVCGGSLLVLLSSLLP